MTTYGLTKAWATDLAGMPVDHAQRVLGNSTPPPPSIFRPMSDDERAAAKAAGNNQPDNWVTNRVP